MPSQADTFVDFCLRIGAGPYRYYQGGNRCDPVRSGYADCSGLVVSGHRYAGYNMACTGSFQQSRWCHQYRTGISIDQARRTRGALLFIGANEGQGLLDGSADGAWPGHVAVSLGNGETIEARNSRAGILVGPFDGRGWTYAARSPFLKYTTPIIGPTPSEPIPEEEDMIMVVTPHKGTPKGRTPVALLVPALNVVVLKNGARIKGDKKNGPTEYVWVVPGTGKPVSMAKRLDGKGIVVLKEDNGTFDGMFSGV